MQQHDEGMKRVGCVLWWIRSRPTKNPDEHGIDDGECGLFGPPVELAREEIEQRAGECDEPTH